MGQRAIEACPLCGNEDGPVVGPRYRDGWEVGEHGACTDCGRELRLVEIDADTTDDGIVVKQLTWEAVL